MSETIDELTIAYTENDIETTRELDKCVLSKGAWTTILYRYQDLDRKNNAFGPVKYSIRRYQKRNNQYQLKSKFNVSSNDQAKKIVDILTGWIDKTAE